MTEEVFYQDPYLREMEAEIVQIDHKGDLVEVILDKTIFYPTGGGQPCDQGEILGEGFRIFVKEVTRRGDRIVHIGVPEGEVKKGKVKLKIDWRRRYELMQQHTGQHILSATILRILEKISTGFQIFDEFSKVEIELSEDLTWDLVERLEEEANRAARSGMEVKTYFGEAKGLRKRPDKFHGELRIVEIGNYDRCACGGLHVKNSCEVLPIKILRFYRKTSKVWRIEFACGDRALRRLNEILRERENALKILGKRDLGLVEAIKSVLKEIERLREKEKNWRSEYVKRIAEFLRESRFELLGRQICIGRAKIDVADKICEELSDLDVVAIIDGRNLVIYSKEGIAKTLLKELQKIVGGRGGGSPNFVRGRFEREISLEDLKEAIRSILSVPSQ